MYIMRSIAVHLLLLYSNNLKTHMGFFYTKETKDLAGDEQIQKKIYESWQREEDVEIII